MADGHAPPSDGRTLIAGYANYFEVGHNPYEFLIDFGQIDPQRGTATINSRLALGPTHAKLLMRLLSRSVEQFERDFGAIADVREDDPLASILDISPDFERRAAAARRKPRSTGSGSALDDPKDR
ncbi:DUF3467 domain-containing protein [uncultured Roseobacter sp.]|uniref:DUF3467 domain-containing protein n=1 Tax=uncultured Roseobacter sp. TaxID=114847 RepID=UPI0026385163|nr:DUF3467 domain-containing protein [uncultured Roseobacter sp.]